MWTRLDTAVRPLRSFAALLGCRCGGYRPDQALRNSVTAAGLDPDKVAACSDSTEAKNAVHASMQLGTDLNVDQTPWLFIDGRGLPMLEIPYEQLKKIVQWQFDQDKQAGGTAAGR